MENTKPAVFYLTFCVLIATISLGKQSDQQNNGNGNGNSGNDNTNGNDQQPNGNGGNNGENTCSITKGGTLDTFLKGRAELEIPCRYIAGEFFCHSRTRIMAQNSLARDGRSFVYAVFVQKSRDTRNVSGDAVEEYDEISLNMGDLRQLFGKSEDNSTLDATVWEPVTENLFTSGNDTWRLQVDYDAKEVMLTDKDNALQVHLSFVNRNTDMSNAGGLSIVCSDPSFGAASNSSGFLCGDVGTSQNSSSHGNSDQLHHHLKDAADMLGLSLTDYLTYSIFVQQEMLQPNPECRHAAEATSTCAYPVEAVSRCAKFLHRSTYVYKCLDDRNISPVQAFASCVKFRCRKDWAACNELAELLGNCPRYKNLKRQLPCEILRRETEE